MPGRHIGGFREVEFLAFLRGPDRCWPKTITAEAAVIDGGAVRVVVSSAVLAPDGTQLKERVHCRMTVDLSHTMSMPEEWSEPADRGTLIPDPYVLPGSPVAFSGPFLAVWQPRAHPWGVSAKLDLTNASAAGEFDGFLVPSIAIDALARLAALQVSAGAMHVGGFGSIGCLDLYTGHNDAELQHAFGHGVTVYYEAATPDRAAIGHMVAPDGRVLARLHDVGAVERGTFDPATGRFSY